MGWNLQWGEAQAETVGLRALALDRGTAGNLIWHRYSTVSPLQNRIKDQDSQRQRTRVMEWGIGGTVEVLPTVGHPMQRPVDLPWASSPDSWLTC